MTIDSTAKAGGSGYCKLSVAFDKAMRKFGFPDLHGDGEIAVIDWLESQSYKVIKVI